jgi:hypothetical protein
MSYLKFPAATAYISTTVARRSYECDSQGEARSACLSARLAFIFIETLGPLANL